MPDKFELFEEQIPLNVQLGFIRCSFARKRILCRTSKTQGNWLSEVITYELMHTVKLPHLEKIMHFKLLQNNQILAPYVYILLLSSKGNLILNEFMGLTSHLELA